MQAFLNMFSWNQNNGRGPWGGRPSGGGGGPRRPGGPEQPDIEDIIRQAQDKFRHMMGGSGGSGGGYNGAVFKLIALVILVGWGASGFYRVLPDEAGVVLRFGKYVETTGPGLRYHLPWPVETVFKPQITRENIMEVGFRSSRPAGQFMGSRFAEKLDNSQILDISEESLMLTGDENIVDLDFTVRWKISDPRAFLFNVEEPVEMVKNAAESAMREIIGHRAIDDALTDNKTLIQQEARELLQSIVDSYRAGVKINSVELQQVNPPKAVIDAFRDVQAARADAEKMQNEAIGYANDILPKARGQVAQIIQQAEGYKASKVAGATGQAERFSRQLKEYAKAKEVTTKRLYIEAMEEVLSSVPKVIMSKEAGGGVLPYLPLEQLKKGGIR